MPTALTIISSMATRQLLNDLGTRYEADNGQTVSIESVGGVEAARRVREGEVFDLVVLAENAIAKLAAEHLLVEASQSPIARCGVAVAVRAGATRPSIDTEAALRDAVANAESIGYSTGPSGVYLQQLFDRWGLAEQVAARTVQAKPGVPVGSLVANGEVALGFQQLSEFVHVEGISIVGMLPAEVQSMTVFSGAVSMASTQADKTRLLLEFMQSSKADDAKIAQGMEPV